MAARSAIANCCDRLSLSCPFCKEADPRLPVSISDWIEKDEQSILFSKNISDNCKIHAVSEDHELVEPSVSLSLFQMDSNSTAASDTQNHLWTQMLFGNEGLRHMEENLYDVISSRELMRTSELLQQSGSDIVTKNEDSPTPFWDLSNLSSFQGEDFTLSSTQKQTLIPFPSNLMEDLNNTSNNYAVSDMKNWPATPPKHGLNGSMQLNFSNQLSMPGDYTLRSGLEFPMANSELGMSKNYNNIEGLETRMKPLKNNSLSIGDDIGRPCYTGTVLAVEGYNVNPFRYQFSSFNKPASYFTSTKTQSQHHQRTAGKIQYRDSKNGMNAKRRKTDATYHDAIFKRPRLDISLPPSKVPKAKFGDRITALQQLVSPFGKTDAASVLFETIAYIERLHEQVQVLSSPYMNSKGAFQGDHKCWGQYDVKKKETKERNQDLKSKGLCLVPLPSTPSC